MTSRFPGFYKLDAWGRLNTLSEHSPLTNEEKLVLHGNALTVDRADFMIENVIGVFGLPLGMAVNFRINGRDCLVPMAVEETSIVAASSCLANLIREHGALEACAAEALMEGQIQLVDVPEPDEARARIEHARDSLLKIANEQDRTLVNMGGGARDIYVRRLDTASGLMLIVHIVVNVMDAMGANAVNTMAEALGPVIAEMTRGEVLCRIITNLADKALTRARFELQYDCLKSNGFSGRTVAERIVKAYHFA
ncbi:MAG: 3-hydroxy-3-methylglutaryl-CoA reductase, partial [Candidatus Riflebacteria bacterium]|nr:3-hydroxy-3-methylglutaryl-CoA reductase [Candidatus Riflebacteria bacterium]